MATNYLVILEDEQTIIRKLSVDHLKEIPLPIKYIIKCVGFYESYNTSSGSIYSYSSVDLNGNPKPIEVGDFVVVDLGTDRGILDSSKRIKVHDKITKVNREFDANHSFEDYILSFLLPIINMLSKAGNWETLDKYKELEMLKIENKRLAQNVDNLKREIEALVKEVNQLKAQIVSDSN